MSVPISPSPTNTDARVSPVAVTGPFPNSLGIASSTRYVAAGFIDWPLLMFASHMLAGYRTR